jgi:hypothetical protein
MKSFVAVATLALAIPATLCTISLGTVSSVGFPFFTIGGGTATTGTAATGLAISGLASGTALAAGLGGVAAAAGAGALAALALRAATRRGKRSVVDDEMVGEQFIFDAINSIDNNNCGKRYVCEIAATPIELLTQAEITSLLLFQTQSHVAESGKAKYDEAVRLGALSRSPLACQKRYSTCPVLQN